MPQIAQISFAGGALVLPAQDPYDREVVFEQAESYARRHGSVGLRVGRAEMRFATSAAETGLPCVRCRQPVGAISVLIARQRFCTHCAKQAVP